MKEVRIFVGVLVILLLSLAAKAQESELDCKTELSIYNEFYNQKNYKDAYPSWSKCFNNCPTESRNIYVQGVAIIEYFIDNAKNEQEKNAFIDTLMMVYDRRIQYYEQEALVLGRKALSMLRYTHEDTQGIYETLEKSFNLAKETSEYFVIEYYMRTAIDLFNAKKIDAQKIFEIYSEVSDALVTGTAAGASKFAETAEIVDDLFIDGGFADCQMSLERFTPKFKEDPTNIDLAKKIIVLLSKGSDDECKLSDLYMNVATLLYNNEKTANSAHSIAQAHLKRKENDKAEKYYLEAIDLENDQLKKADMYYELSMIYYMANEYQKAKNSARTAITNNPNHGRAYIMIGNCYAAGGTNCGESAFDKKMVYCVVVDQFIKARAVDPEYAARANELIGRYSSYFPKREEAFWLGIDEGAPYTVGCWINENTTVRFSD